MQEAWNEIIEIEVLLEKVKLMLANKVKYINLLEIAGQIEDANKLNIELVADNKNLARWTKELEEVKENFQSEYN